jgi:excinuclease ABC subunit C
VIKKRNNFPEKPGVYLFKSKKNKILYIGKAKNIKKRVSQYFKKKNDLIVKNLLNKSYEIDFIVTDDEKDALHLEYNLFTSGI